MVQQRESQPVDACRIKEYNVRFSVKSACLAASVAVPSDIELQALIEEELVEFVDGSSSFRCREL